MNDTDINFSEFDDFVNDAQRDDRIGKHHLMVLEVKRDTWDDGQPRVKVLCQIMSANGKADMTLSRIPPKAQLDVEKATYDSKKKRAIAQQITLQRALAEHYKKSIDTIKGGDEFDGEIVKTKVDAAGKGGFLRIVAVLPLGAASGEGTLKAAAGNANSDPGF